ncbi:hypothetical protein HETIRDRAFT_450244 [Heterobasidion irregulare TC 32-1]|uniref:Uncharacterized protein n=1 Tax=Heterobasidion irregulare (strain TC 32-1) TaxID=747525 RepID=W4KHY1_HETIT|nr:uncharacterized protein HETIRDRAFT_450244 [Heterobasidion irregulare TC 32-1]ETW84925.1 hypothetical protein HETIRDRAFT_450244 [Heterobasidion irregulare TC 32-1]
MRCTLHPVPLVQSRSSHVHNRESPTYLPPLGRARSSSAPQGSDRAVRPDDPPSDRDRHLAAHERGAQRDTGDDDNGPPGSPAPASRFPARPTLQSIRPQPHTHIQPRAHKVRASHGTQARPHGARRSAFASLRAVPFPPLVSPRIAPAVTHRPPTSPRASARPHAPPRPSPPSALARIGSARRAGFAVRCLRFWSGTWAPRARPPSDRPRNRTRNRTPARMRTARLGVETPHEAGHFERTRTRTRWERAARARRWTGTGHLSRHDTPDCAALRRRTSTSGTRQRHARALAARGRLEAESAPRAGTHSHTLPRPTRPRHSVERARPRLRLRPRPCARATTTPPWLPIFRTPLRVSDFPIAYLRRRRRYPLPSIVSRLRRPILVILITIAAIIAVIIATLIVIVTAIACPRPRPIRPGCHGPLGSSRRRSAPRPRLRLGLAHLGDAEPESRRSAPGVESPRAKIEDGHRGDPAQTPSRHRATRRVIPPRAAGVPAPARAELGRGSHASLGVSSPPPPPPAGPSFALALSVRTGCGGAPPTRACAVDAFASAAQRAVASNVIRRCARPALGTCAHGGSGSAGLAAAHACVTPPRDTAPWAARVEAEAGLLAQRSARAGNEARGLRFAASPGARAGVGPATPRGRERAALRVRVRARVQIRMAQAPCQLLPVLPVRGLREALSCGACASRFILAAPRGPFARRDGWRVHGQRIGTRDGRAPCEFGASGCCLPAKGQRARAHAQVSLCPTAVHPGRHVMHERRDGARRKPLTFWCGTRAVTSALGKPERLGLSPASSLASPTHYHRGTRRDRPCENEPSRPQSLPSFAACFSAVAVPYVRLGRRMEAAEPVPGVTVVQATLYPLPDSGLCSACC